MSWLSLDRISKLLLASISQISVSATSFVWTFFLLHSLQTDDFGKFGLIQAISLLVSGLIGTAFFMPNIVRIASNKPEIINQLVKKLIPKLFIPFLIFSPLILLERLIGIDSVIFWAFILGVALAPRDYFTRSSIVGGTPSWSLWPNFVVFICSLIIIGLVFNLNLNLSLNAYLYTLLFSALLAPIMGYLWMSFDFSKKTTEDIDYNRNSIGNNERITYGLSFISGWIQAQALIVFAYYVIGPESSGLLAAARILVAPLVMLAPVINSSVMHHFGASKIENRVKMWREASIIAALGAGVYCVVVILLSSYLTKLFFPPATTPSYIVISGVVLMSGLQLIRDVSRSVLYSIHRSSDVFLESFRGALLLLVALSFGSVILGLTLTNLVWLAVVAEFMFVTIIIIRTKNALVAG